MTGHVRLPKRVWLLAAAIVALIAGHVVILHSVSKQLALSAAAVSSVIVLIVIKHLGLLAPLYALFRRRTRP
jgi:hypothetical protein